jgi:hypothetical protein
MPACYHRAEKAVRIVAGQFEKFGSSAVAKNADCAKRGDAAR